MPVHTLDRGSLVQLLDREGREVHPGKRGRILRSEPAALERIRAMALGGEIEEPAMSRGADTSLELAATPPSGSMPCGLPSLAALEASVRTTVNAALAVIEGHRRVVEELLEDEATPGGPEAPPEGDASEPPAPATPPASAPKRARVRWFGSANGPKERIAAEAARRGSFRVVSERPLAAA